MENMTFYCKGHRHGGLFLVMVIERNGEGRPDAGPEIKKAGPEVQGLLIEVRAED